jgi:hypothetical protein
MRSAAHFARVGQRAVILGTERELRTAAESRLSLTMSGGVIRCELSRGTDATPLGLMNLAGRISQGSYTCLATPGFEAQSLRDCRTAS